MKKKEVLDRRDMIKTAVVGGLGMAALSNLNPGQVLANTIPGQPTTGMPPQATAVNSIPEKMYVPGNPVLTEFLYNSDDGVINAMRANPSGIPTLSTDSSLNNASFFELFDHGEYLEKLKATGVEAGGPNGEFRIKIGRLENNPNAAPNPALLNAMNLFHRRQK